MVGQAEEKRTNDIH